MRVSPDRCACPASEHYLQTFEYTENAGLLEAERRGKWVYYRMLNANKHVGDISDLIRCMAIEDALDEGLPLPYDKAEYERKCAAVFEHVYERYQGDGKSVFLEAA